MPCHVMICHVMSRYVMLCNVILCHVRSCHVMSCYVVLCHVVSRVHWFFRKRLPKPPGAKAAPIIRERERERKRKDKRFYFGSLCCSLSPKERFEFAFWNKPQDINLTFQGVLEYRKLNASEGLPADPKSQIQLSQLVLPACFVVGRLLHLFRSSIQVLICCREWP